VSSRARRISSCAGESSRSASSMEESTSVGSARSAFHASPSCASRFSRLPSRLVVVSLPATSSNTAKPTISSSDS
jgi:hypothetical protein